MNHELKRQINVFLTKIGLKRSIFVPNKLFLMQPNKDGINEKINVASGCTIKWIWNIPFTKNWWVSRGYPLHTEDFSTVEKDPFGNIYVERRPQKSRIGALT